MRTKALKLQGGDQVMVYSNHDAVFLQLRHEVPTEEDILTPSAKVAVALTTSEMLELASELLTIANGRLNQQKL